MLKDVARVVAAYVGNNRVAAEDLPTVIRDTHAALSGMGVLIEPAPELVPAVPVKKSIRADSLICLECGKSQKTLKRHLTSAHKLGVDEYRAKWDLPRDYPMVAPDYAELRSQLAKTIGLGTKRPEPDAPQDVLGEGEVEARKHHYPTNRWSKPTEV